MKQHTLKREILISGIGVHTGKEIHITLKPNAPNSGIAFQKDGILIKAHYTKVVDTTMCTVLGEHDAKISTIEHLMSALWGCSIDNLIIEIDGPEVPIMDGSAKCFVDKILEAGIEPQNVHRSYLNILRPVEILTPQGGQLFIAPAESFSIDYEVDFPHPSIGKQQYHFSSTPEFFRDTFSNARTFGFMKDLEMLQGMGLAQGASLENAIGFDDEKMLNSTPLRHQEEIVLHKILDCIGDLYLAGMPIIGAVKAVKAGHKMHIALLKEIFSSPENYEVR